MKKLLLANSLFFLSSLFLSAQTHCGSPWYDTVVFSNITVTSNVVYGWNVNSSNAMDTLKMDIYQPTGDTAATRPVIIFAHGGSFISGSKTDSYAIDFCTRFAKRGYVAASINYRLGMSFPINQTNGQKAVWRATQDMKAAVRYFRKDAHTANVYKIDTNYVFAAGYSAGAFMAVQYAYLDQSSEVPSAIDTTLLGGLEGNSGNAGYSSRINAVVNLAGAIGDTLWMKAGDEPMVTAQGNNDNTVPYCKAMIYVSSFPVMVVCGGGAMNPRCVNLGIYNPIHTYYGQDHQADLTGANMDSTTILVSDFLYKQLGCVPTNTAVYTNAPTCVAGSGVNEIVLSAANVEVYPVPASFSVSVSLKEVKGKKFSVELSDLSGRTVQQFSVRGSDFNVERNKLENGIYFLKLVSDEHEVFVTKILFAE